MGIYPEHRTIPADNQYASTWVEEIKEPGLIKRRTVTAGEWTEERSDCYCCSCTYDDYHARPCERHNMPGAPDDDGTMPTSVQAELARQQAARHST